MKCRWWGGAAVALGCALPAGATGQNAPPVDVGGLLRVGAAAGADSAAAVDGFRLYEARLRVSGKIGIVFDYRFQTRYDPDEDVLTLWDAAATLPLIPEVELTFGLFKPFFGLEASQARGEITFHQRSQASTAIAPWRQVGMQASGSALDGRLAYGAGMYNGNGRSVSNDGGNYMFAGRLQYNSIGTVAFYDDLVVQAGLSLGHSSDTSAPLGIGIVTGDPAAAPHITTDFAGRRLFWGGDVQVTYRQWSLTGEYLRGEYELDMAPGGTTSAETEASGGYVEFGFRAWGALEAVARYDTFRPALGAERDFVVFGLNVYPGYYAKFSLQYALAQGDSPDAPTLADGQLTFLAQVDF